MEQKVYFSSELKQADGEEGVFSGYASTFGNEDTVGDIVDYGAFAESLAKREPKVLWQHKMDKPVGKLLEAKEDAKGLFVRVKLALGTTLGRDAYEYMKAGIIDRLSIGFMVKEAAYDQNTNIRTIKKAELFEFSLVTIPANDEAAITSVKSVPQTERDFEKFLREAGYSRTEAKAITSRGIKGYQDVLRDAGVDTPNDVLREADEVKKLLSQLCKTLGVNDGRDVGNQIPCGGDQ